MILSWAPFFQTKYPRTQNELHIKFVSVPRCFRAFLLCVFPHASFVCCTDPGRVPGSDRAALWDRLLWSAVPLLVDFLSL